MTHRLLGQAVSTILDPAPGRWSAPREVVIGSRAARSAGRRGADKANAQGAFQLRSTAAWPLVAVDRNAALG
ncbi:hypothetical protein XalbCFBP2523_05245 [Xanthomonas albilineans]|nr:hypothetical protein XalbCFBP2523_05245 [Xanthomonas albilineans]